MPHDNMRNSLARKYAKIKQLFLKISVHNRVGGSMTLLPVWLDREMSKTECVYKTKIIKKNQDNKQNECGSACCTLISDTRYQSQKYLKVGAHSVTTQLVTHLTHSYPLTQARM